TGGSYYDIKNATEFNSAMNEIFADLSGNPGNHLKTWFDNGRYYTTFEISSGNILQANIVILTSKGVSDPQIEDPYGNNVTNDPNKVVITYDQGAASGGVSAYTVMKVRRPDIGTWTVSVAGDADDAIDITLLTTKDVAFTLGLDGTPESKKPFKIKAFMADQDGTNLKDGSLFDNSVAELTVTDEQGQPVAGYEKVLMTYDSADASYGLDVTLPFGKYNADVEMTSRDQNTNEEFTRKSNTLVIGVGRTPMEMKNPDEEVKASLWTAPIDTKKTFNLKDLITAESLDGLTVQVLQRDDSNDNIIEVSYDESTKDFTISPLKTGNLTEKILVYNPAYEESIVIDLQVKVTPVWPFILIACVLIAAIIVVIILVKRARRPVLKGAVTVELVLPPMFAKLTTAPQTINMPGKSYKIDLASLIQGDPMALASYQESIARTGIIEILKKIEFTPGKNDVTNMRILPKVQGKIYINNQPVNNAKGITCQLNKNLQHVIQYSTDGTNSTTIKLSMNESGKSPWSTGMDGGPSFGGDNFGDDTFGGNTFGGAPFGGSSGMGNAPFGGDNGNFGGAPFGGSSSQGGFGGSGFGDSQPGGNSGGFGGNSFGGPQSGNSGQGGFGGNGFGGPQSGNGGQGGDSFSNPGGFGGSSSQGNSFNFGDDDDKTMPGGFF
ncbi:MAG: hypothetical protein Q4B26_12655, partial [Eubacteriales bacterium]|nr:hypothetical protein [Eubacteriales bacterium]